jgi:hypothetical protein
MNRRGFFGSLGKAVAAAFILPTAIISWCPVKQTIIQPVSDNSVLMGYKGAQFLEAGYVYAPYIPLVQTCLLVKGKRYKV